MAEAVLLALSLRTPDEAHAASRRAAALCAEAFAVEQALFELLVNAIEHGNLEIGAQRKVELRESGQWEVEVVRRLGDPVYAGRAVSLRLVAEEADRGRFEIADQGCGFDPAPWLQLDPARADALSGRGIALARMLAFADLAFIDGGRCAIAHAVLRRV